jgi:putative redox protein
MKQRIEIPNSNGEILHATLELPANKQVAQYAIFAHCFTCSSQLSIVRTISGELTQYGFGVLRFDFTGLGGSEGDFADTNFSHNVSDLLAVNAYMVAHYAAPTLLIGHSLGGAAVLMAAADMPHVRALVTIGAPAHAQHVSHLLGDAVAEIHQTGEAEVAIGGRPFKVKKHFIDDLEQHDISDLLPALRVPLLILHSPQDRIVGIENAAEIYRLAHHPKSFISLDGADHLLTNKADSLYVARTIATWAQRYLMFDTDTADTAPLQPDNAQVVAHLDMDNGFKTHISNGRHAIIADEPVEDGGEDAGFGPYELLQAALGACTNMTLRLYAERKKWPLEEVYTHLAFAREPQVDGGKQDVITKKIELVGDLTAEQRERLLEIADKCPVNKTLQQAMEIRTLPWA